MNKIKIQLEKAIEKGLISLFSANNEFSVDGNLTKLAQIRGVELYQQNHLDDDLKNGKNHAITLWGIVSALEKIRNGSEIVNLVFRESNIGIIFEWESNEFSIENINTFHFSRLKL